MQALVLKYASEIPLYGVDVGVAVCVAVCVAVGVEVCVCVGVAVAVGVCVAGCVAVAVAVKVGVGVAVDGAVVAVAVGGWELCRAIRGLIHRAKSSCEEPLARTDRINLTFSPLSVLKSMLIGYS